jgi:NNP family nitrate/nitrite transporter-like MFS transporter
MSDVGKAVRIDLFTLRTPQMRAFHLSWGAFFSCFFAWFAVAPLMPVIRDELGLTPSQVASTMIASVAGTILARLAVGRLCDRFGPRRVYTGLLLGAALPVLGVAFSWSYHSLLVFRLLIGAIGASFVVTQYHVSSMFAANTVGTANAMTAGWGNLGGGVVQLAMPMLLALLLAFGTPSSVAWRVALAAPALALVTMAVLYYRFTQDTPAGNFTESSSGAPRSGTGSTFWLAARDPRVWALAVAYAGCFGVELTINNVAALYFRDRFDVTTTVAGGIAALHGLLNVFARALGGALGDRVGTRFGLSARVRLLGGLLLLEGVLLTAFGAASSLALAVALLIGFSLFVEMACGATYAVVPFVNPRALGSISGIVGAGGNVGAVLAAFLFRSESLGSSSAFMVLGTAVVFCAIVASAVRFTPPREITVAPELAPPLPAE